MRWENVSPRDFGCQREDTRYTIRGEVFSITVYHPPYGDAWYLNCNHVDATLVRLQAKDSRSARIEAVETVARRLESALAQVNAMKLVEP